jgi:hypothetical protein
MTLKLNRRTWLVLLFAVVTAGAILLVGYWSWNASPLEPPEPNPNGYDDLVAAGNMMRGLDLDIGNATEIELRQFVATNAAAMERARLGLTRQCRVPAVALSGSSNILGHINDLASLKRLANTFRAEGRLAELEGRPMEAAASALAIIKVGIGASHGGCLIDSLVADACEASGCRRLDTIMPKLSAAQSRQVGRQLEASLAQVEPKSEILRHEARFGRRAIGGSLQYFLHTLGRGIIPAWRNTDKSVLAKYDNQIHWMLAEEIQLAAQAYELEQGRKAQVWGDLVPAYLKAIPQDPLTGSNFNMTRF